MKKINLVKGSSCILFIDFISDYLGGGERHLCDLANGLSKFYNIIILTSSELLTKQLDTQITVKVIKYPYKSYTLIGYFYNYIKIKRKVIKSLRKIVYDFNPDIVFLNQFNEELYLTKWLYKKKIKVIWIQHYHPGIEIYFSKLKIYKLIVYYFLFHYIGNRYTAKIVCDSNSIRLLLTEKFRLNFDKNIVINCGIKKMRNLFKDNEKANVKDEVLKIGYTAHITKLKGQDYISELVIYLKKRGLKNFIILLAGKIYDNKLFNKIRNIKEVKVLSDVTKENLYNFLNTIDIYISLSKSEGFPYNILEAMNAGLPIVAFDVGGIKEQIVDGDTGYLIPQGNVDLFASRIIELAKDIEKRKNMGTNAHKRLINYFSYDKMIRNYVDLVKTVLNNDENRY